MECTKISPPAQSPIKKPHAPRRKVMESYRMSTLYASDQRIEQSNALSTSLSVRRVQQSLQSTVLQ